jgi:hypothetical protein
VPRLAHLAEYAYFFFYSLVRSLYLARQRRRLQRASGVAIGTAAELALGALAGALAQVFTIPVAVVRASLSPSATTHRCEVETFTHLHTLPYAHRSPPASSLPGHPMARPAPSSRLRARSSPRMDLQVSGEAFGPDSSSPSTRR